MNRFVDRATTRLRTIASTHSAAMGRNDARRCPPYAGVIRPPASDRLRESFIDGRTPGAGHCQPGLAPRLVPARLSAEPRRCNERPSHHFFHGGDRILPAGTAGVPGRLGRRAEEDSGPSFIQPRGQALERYERGNPRGTGPAIALAAGYRRSFHSHRVERG